MPREIAHENEYLREFRRHVRGGVPLYEQHLGGTISMLMTHGQAPDQSQVKPEWKDAVLHARITLGGVELMGADIPDAQPMRSA